MGGPKALPHYNIFSYENFSSKRLMWLCCFRSFKNSFVHLGANAKVPVIPIVIYGSHIVMKDKKFFPSRGKVYINILPPVVLNCKANSLEKEKNLKYMEMTITHMMALAFVNMFM